MENWEYRARDKKNSVYTPWTYLYLPQTRTPFGPAAVGDPSGPKPRHKRWYKQYRKRLAAVASNEALHLLLESLGPRTTRATWAAFRASLYEIWLDGAGVERGAYRYTCEWLLRALAYALDVPSACFDGLDDVLTQPKLWEGLRYRDAFAASASASLPVSLIAVIVCEAGGVFGALDPAPPEKKAKKKPKNKWKVEGCPFQWNSRSTASTSSPAS